MDTPKLDEAAIFNAARQITAAAARQQFLEQSCGGDQNLQARVEALLRIHEKDRSFLEEPAQDAPTISEDRISEGPGRHIGAYKLLEQIGEGGFGIVFMAEQAEPIRRRVALKILKPGMDTRQVVARFESERQALALMVHPNIAQIFDGGETDTGRPYFVMELVKGVPITEFCDKNRLPAEARLKLFVSVCHAIQHAHHKGIIHRDIKPSNVMVTLHDGVPAVKIIDFGVAKATAHELTEKTYFTAYGQMIGTPAYMSPEQAEMSGLDIDTRSDIYSLGVLLYELLTGTTPIELARLRAAGYAEVQRLIREEEPQKPSTRLSSLGDSATIVAGNRGMDPKQLSRLLSGDLDWIVMKALEKDRTRRYETPGSFAQDVDRYLKREAVLARPPSAWYRLRKFAQRHRVAVLASSAVLFALVAGSAVAAWQAVEATKAKHDALGAAAAEKTAKNIAVEKEAETRAVLDFVQKKVIAAARPEGLAGGRGYDVSLRGALKAALESVEESFTNQPLVEARVRGTLGESFLLLGDADIAADQFIRVRSIFTERLGPDNVETLRSMNELGTSYRALGRYGDAQKLSERTLALCETNLGPDHRVTLKCMNNLATVLADQDRFADALKLRQKALAIRKEKFGADDAETIMAMNDLANTYAGMRRYEDALNLNHEAFTIARAKLGPVHADTLHVMNSLALDYGQLRRFDDALKLQEESLAAHKTKFGPDHPQTLVSMGNVAKALVDLRQYDKAVKLFEETLRLQKIKPGPEHPYTLHTMYALANAYGFQRRYGDAFSMHEAALELRKRKLGLDHQDTLYSMWGVSVNLLKLGRGPEAVPLIDECLERAARNVPDRRYSGLTTPRMNYFRSRKDAAGCRKTAELWEKFQFTDAASLYTAARYRAITALVLRESDSKSEQVLKEVQVEADLAMAFLHKAVAADYKEAVRMKTDIDLLALRGRADFQKLVETVEADKAKEKK
ncbi:MAG: serine/threonine protein kinase [Planctomycetes bacterium]|nr:serine/threonine protein kinase [Planctomycetota bacterium]